MIELDKSPDAYRLRDGPWELSFRLVGDRWQHALAARQGNAWRPLLVSDEGQPGDESLRTPVFQDLRCEEPVEGIVEFQLMGQSGPGVYSGAVRYSEADRTLDFDLCGRARSGAVGLCTFTTYQLGDADCRPFVNQVIQPSTVAHQALLPAPPRGRGAGGEGARANDTGRDCQAEIPLTPNPSPAGGEGDMILAARDSFEGRAIPKLEGTSAMVSLEGISLLLIEPVPIAGSPAGECRISDEGGRARLVVGCFESGQPEPRQKPANIRWRYRITASGQP